MTLTIADLSAVEKEALHLLRGDEPRNLLMVAWSVGASEELRGNVNAVLDPLLGKRLIEVAPNLQGFVVLTAEGLRLQAELFAEDTP